MNLYDLRAIANDVLLQRTEELAAKEREITLEVLHHLREIERRLLYAELGYSSLLVYCVKVLRYSETAAYRRIGSMRLLNEVPEIEVKLLSGELTLTNAAQVQAHFRKIKAQARANAGGSVGNRPSPSAAAAADANANANANAGAGADADADADADANAGTDASMSTNSNAAANAFGQEAGYASFEAEIEQKRAILKQVDSLSVRGCQRVLGDLRRDKAPPERSRPLNADETHYSVTLDRETEAMLSELQRELHRTMSMRELIKETARIALAAIKTKNQKRKERALKSQQAAPPTDVGRRKTKRSAPPAAQSRDTGLKASTTESQRPLGPIIEPWSLERTQAQPIVTIDPRASMGPKPQPDVPIVPRASMGLQAQFQSQASIQPHAPEPEPEPEQTPPDVTIDPPHAVEPQSQFHPTRQLPRKSRKATRYISAATKTALWERAHGRCEFCDPCSGRRCEETRYLEIEHIRPHALGGSNELNNLELLCRGHNKLKALYVFGRSVMKPHMPSLR